MMFIVVLLLSHVVSWVRCGTWLYRFLIFAVLTLQMTSFFELDLYFMMLFLSIKFERFKSYPSGRRCRRTHSPYVSTLLRRRHKNSMSWEIPTTTSRIFFLKFDLVLYVLVSNISAMSVRVFLGWASTKQGLMGLAQEHTAVAQVRL